MKFVLTVILLLSSIADICLAEDVVSDSSSQSSAVSEGVAFSAEEPVGHCNDPRSHGASNSAHQCHLGHCGLIFESKFSFNKLIPVSGRSSYSFALTSADIASKKRPPKSRV